MAVFQDGRGIGDLGCGLKAQGSADSAADELVLMILLAIKHAHCQADPSIFSRALRALPTCQAPASADAGMVASIRFHG